MSLSTEPALVRQSRRDGEDVCVLEIVPAAGIRPFEAGSHIDITVYVAGQPQTRSYSLIRGVADDAYVIAVRRLHDGRGGSLYMHSLAPGARVQISQPKNLFPLNYQAPAYLLVAGGIGVTPLISMADVLVRRGAQLRFLYLGRSRGSMPFLELLQSLLGEQLVVHADDEAGRFDLEDAILSLPDNGEAYVCGPTPLLEAFRNAWDASGRAPEAMRFETFGSSGHRPAVPFTVRVPRLGLDCVVPANRTLLDVLEEAGAEPLYNCRRGECGLCSVEVLDVDGLIDHRDVFFSDRQKVESSHLCACVSRVAGGNVTIELP